MPEGLVDELREVKPAPGARLSEGGEGATLPRRDVRARRQMFLKGLLRLGLLRALTRILSLAVLDVLGIVLALWTALELRASIRPEVHFGENFGEALDYAPLAVLVTVLLFARSGLYGERGVRPGFTRVVSSLFQATVVILIYAFVEGLEFSSYYLFYGSLFFALIYVSVFRWGFERLSGALLRAAGYRRRAILVGSGEHIEAVAHALAGSRQSGIDPVGFVSLRPLRGNGLPDLGPLDQIERRLDSVDEVLIADPAFPQEQAVELVERCHERGIRVRVAPSTMEILMNRIEFVPGQTLPLFELKPPVFEGADFLIKRSFDVVVSFLMIVALAPLMGLIAVLIRATSRGPVIYRSLRPGIAGEPFWCLKFRTMHQDAEHQQEELEQRYLGDSPMFKMKDDPRVTRVGSWLRRFSLDELPQLFNVLKGEMSLVGPRPLPQHDYDRLEDWHRKRYLVMPGMTGLWQVSGRSELDFDELVRLDFLYLERWSVFLDLTIMLKTIPAILRARGAW